MTNTELDLMDSKAFLDGVPHAYFRDLRHREGLLRADNHEGEQFWYVVRHADVVAASRDTHVFSSSPTTMTRYREMTSQLRDISFTDPPDHTRMRRQSLKAFTPARMASLEGRVNGIVESVWARATAKGMFDLAKDVALEVPVRALAELLGIPEADRPTVFGWAKQAVNRSNPDFGEDPANSAEYFMAIAEYFENLVEQKRAEPADDMITVLLTTPVKGQTLSKQEIVQLAMTITGGSESTYSALTGGAVALMEHPDQVRLLREDRRLIPRAVGEILRWVTPVTHFARTAVTDTEIAGQSIRAGEHIAMWFISANYDETVFTDPMRFDVTRTPNPQITFGGGGPHVCLGRALAIMELRHLIELIVDEPGLLRPAGDARRAHTNFTNSIMSAPVTLR